MTHFTDALTICQGPSGRRSSLGHLTCTLTTCAMSTSALMYSQGRSGRRNSLGRLTCTLMTPAKLSSQ